MIELLAIFTAILWYYVIFDDHAILIKDVGVNWLCILFSNMQLTYDNIVRFRSYAMHSSISQIIVYIRYEYTRKIPGDDTI